MSLRPATTFVLVLASAAALLAQDAAPQPHPRNPAASVDPESSASPRAAAEKLAGIFPALYWHASDARLRETTRHGLGHPQKLDDFVKNNKAVIEQFDPLEGKGAGRYLLRLRIHDPANPKEYWVLELTGEGKKWEPQAGFKHVDGQPMLDLFKDGTFGGTRAMGSMKPYFQKLLAAYSEGKDLAAVFVKKAAGYLK